MLCKMCGVSPAVNEARVIFFLVSWRQVSYAPKKLFLLSWVANKEVVLFQVLITFSLDLFTAIHGKLFAWPTKWRDIIEGILFFFYRIPKDTLEKLFPELSQLLITTKSITWGRDKLEIMDVLVAVLTNIFYYFDF